MRELNNFSASSLDSSGPRLPSAEARGGGAGDWVVEGGGGGGWGGGGAGVVTLLLAAAWRLEDGESITRTFGINLEVNLFFLAAEIENIPRPEVFDGAESVDSSLSSCLAALIGVARLLFFRSSS